MKNGVKVAGDKIIIVYNGMQAMRIINNIRFCSSCHNYSEIYFDTDNPVIAPIGINKLSLLLPEESFYKCHRLYIINLEILYEAIVKDGKILYHEQVFPVSRNRVKEFRHKAEAYRTYDKAG